MELARAVGATVPEVVQISYSNGMNHLTVLRDKIGRLREEIANIQKSNEQFRREGWNGADAQVAHGQRNERLQAIQHELVRLADLGRKVVSTEQMREKHRSRLHLANQKTGIVAFSTRLSPRYLSYTNLYRAGTPTPAAK